MHQGCGWSQTEMEVFPAFWDGVRMMPIPALTNAAGERHDTLSNVSSFPALEAIVRPEMERDLLYDVLPFRKRKGRHG